MHTNYAKVLAVAVGLTAAASPVLAGTITVNEGSATDGYVPFHFYYLDNAKCRSQVIFPAEQLQAMKGQAIKELKFHINEDGYASAWAANDMRLSIAETDKNAFDTDESRYAEFMEPDWTVAYSGPMEGAAGGRELVFILSSPYTYTGSNLLIQISLGEAGNAYPTTKFFGINTTDYYPSAYTTSGSTTYAEGFLPMTTFTYGEVPPFEAKVSTEAINFATVLLGQSATASVKVSNSGANAFPISVSAPADNAFSTGNVPASLESGQSIEIPFTFTPSAAGDFNTTVTLDFGEAGSFPINLSGKGMKAPTGYTADFGLPSNSLPENWTGWAITREYDFGVGDYVEIVDAKETMSYFNSYTSGTTSGMTVEEGNHIREYPNMIFVYMISPEIEGNFMIQAATTGSNYALDLYPATKAADGSWTIGTEALKYTWASMPDGSWGIAIGSVAAGTRIAIDAQNMAIATFAADNLGGSSAEYSAAFSAESIAFGEVTVGENASKSITLTNKGTKAFDISMEPVAESAFTATCGTTTLEPGISTDINVVFAPTAAGTFTSELKLSLGNAGSYAIALSGEGKIKSTDVPVGTEFTSNGIDYTVTAAGEVSVSGVASGVEECIVPATVTNADGAAFAVVAIGREAFYWSSTRKVVLPEGLRSIGYGAFRQSDLAEINLPSTLTEIGDFAFRTTKITSIDIPEGISSLGGSVFASCELLSEVKLPSTLRSLGNGVFYKTAITSIELPEGCTDIAEEVFEACPALSNVKLPANLTEIKSMTFMDCPSLTSIEIPAKVRRINTLAFSNSGLTSLNIPASVDYIASNTFTNSPIAEITVEASNKDFKTIDGVLYSADGNFLYLYPRNTAVSYAVAEGTRGIIGGAFYKSAVKTAVLPESLVGIDEMAFCNSALESISIPDGVSVILGQAFAGTQLKELVLPAGLTKIEEALVADCASLTSITLGESLADVGNRAFYNCTALESIVCKGSTPSEFDGWEGFTDPFRGVDKTRITVYCPDGAVADYKASEWGDFFDNIKGMSELSGISSVGAGEIAISGGNSISVKAPEAVYVQVFDMAGRKVFSAETANATVEGLASGLYIVKAGTATVKVTVK